MNTLTKMALGMIGQLKPVRAKGSDETNISLPRPTVTGGLPLMDVLRKRHSEREFANTALPLQVLSDLL